MRLELCPNGPPGCRWTPLCHTISMVCVPLVCFVDSWAGEGPAARRLWRRLRGRLPASLPTSLCLVSTPTFLVVSSCRSRTCCPTLVTATWPPACSSWAAPLSECSMRCSRAARPRSCPSWTPSSRLQLGRPRLPRPLAQRQPAIRARARRRWCPAMIPSSLPPCRVPAPAAAAAAAAQQKRWHGRHERRTKPPSGWEVLAVLLN